MQSESTDYTFGVEHSNVLILSMPQVPPTPHMNGILSETSFFHFKGNAQGVCTNYKFAFNLNLLVLKRR
jgi:hypothetical protein